MGLVYICDISTFYFSADFPFNIGLYDNVFITCGLLTISKYYNIHLHILIIYIK
jgi:hypothetical protein